MNVLLLVSAFNGLTQRVWCTLRSTPDVRVSVALAETAGATTETVRSRQPDLVICPFLKERIPAEVWSHYRTIIIHPGPVGDRGPSSLDHAISDAVPVWGVTALQAVEEMDAGPIWATRTFAMPGRPSAPLAKSVLYNGPVADAAVECVLEVVEKAKDPLFHPVPLAAAPREVPGTRLRPLLRQAERSFSWTDGREKILRRVAAADGAPGVLTTLGGSQVYAYDAHPGPALDLAPGQVGGARHGAVLVGTGNGNIWIGHLRRRPTGGTPTIKLPAAQVLGDLPELPDRATAGEADYRPIRYWRVGDVGHVEFDFYNGAMSTAQCRRLADALGNAAAQDTRVLVLHGGAQGGPFSNGVHLNVIEAAANGAAEGWANIRAINAVCRAVVECAHQVVITAFSGNAGAGGVMLGLGADVVAARDGVVFNPCYDIGLYGSELHTYTLPRRVGAERAARLLGEKLPVDAAQAKSLGLVDEVGPSEEEYFAGWLTDLAKRYADPVTWRQVRSRKERALAEADRPVDYYEIKELAEMAADLFDDRQGFAAARGAFVYKTKSGTPKRLTGWA